MGRRCRDKQVTAIFFESVVSRQRRIMPLRETISIQELLRKPTNDPFEKRGEGSIE